jgi:hypothetical protein
VLCQHRHQKEISVRNRHAPRSNGRHRGTFHSDETVIGLQTRLPMLEASRYRVLMQNGSAILHFEGKKFVLTSLIRAPFDDMRKRKSIRRESFLEPSTMMASSA